MSLQRVYEWLMKLKSRVSNLSEAAGAARSHITNRPDVNTEMERMIQESRLVTIDKMGWIVKISHGAAYHIIPEVLQN